MRGASSPPTRRARRCRSRARSTPDAKGETAANLAIVPVSPSGIGVNSFGGADLVVDLAGWFVGSPVAPTTGDAPTNVRPPVCIADTSADSLTALFASGDPIIGADYQRAYPLPDGRTLWMFQDVLVRSRAGATFVHNAGLIQTGNCFALLQSGNYASPGNYVLHAATNTHAALVLGARRRHGHRREVPPARRRDARARSRVPVVDRADRDVERLDRPRRHVDRRVRAGERQLGRAVRVLGHVRRDLHLSLLALLPAVRLGPVAVRRARRCTRTTSTALRTSTSRACRAAASTRRSSTGTVRRGSPTPPPRSPVIPRRDRLVNPTQVIVRRQAVHRRHEGGRLVGRHHLPRRRHHRRRDRGARTGRSPSRPSAPICNTYFASFVPWRAADGSLVVGLLAQHVRRRPDRAVLPTLLHRPGAVTESAGGGPYGRAMAEFAFTELLPLGPDTHAVPAGHHRRRVDVRHAARARSSRSSRARSRG